MLACIVSFGGYIYGLSHRFAHSPTQAPKTSAGIDGQAIKHICMELPGHSSEFCSLCKWKILARFNCNSHYFGLFETEKSKFPIVNQYY